MGLSDRKRRSVRQDVPDNPVEDVVEEVSDADDGALANIGDDFLDSPVASALPTAPTGEQVVFLCDA